MKFDRLKNFVNKPFQQAFARFEQFAGFGLHAEPTERDRMFMAILKWVVSVNGVTSERARSALRDFRDSHQSGDSEIWEYLHDCEPQRPTDCLDCFSQLPAAERLSAVLGLVELATVAGSYDDAHRAEFGELAAKLELPDADFSAGERKIAEAELRRARLMRSGAGLVVALVVLLVFILTATWLRSVIFGLILAYICLPLEKLIERVLFRKVPFNPDKVSPHRSMTDEVVGRIRRFVGSEDGQQLDLDSPEKLHRDNLIKRASTATVVLVTLFMFVCVILLGSWGAGYLSSLGHSVRGWIDAPTTVTAVESDTAPRYIDDSAVDSPATVVPESEPSEFVDRVGAELNKLKIKFKNIPLVSRGIDEIGCVLRDPDAQRHFIGTLFEKSGGILQFSLSALGSLAAILLDILLTVFFFSLFLRTLALKTDARGGGQSLSTYCVNTVFNGHWLPVADGGTMKEAERVIDGVVYRLKVWLRGYIILISIDFVVYTTAFTLLGVPYAPILGFIAGCGLLLPYIGPIASALLTVLVTLALGGDTISGWQIAGIAAVYLVENGIVEQFFLYPAVIGEALGLSTLETIIVVLLGGMLAGITGMIFALPTAAVIKFIVPQIYRTVGR